MTMMSNGITGPTRPISADRLMHIEHGVKEAFRRINTSIEINADDYVRKDELIDLINNAINGGRLEIK